MKPRREGAKIRLKLEARQLSILRLFQPAAISENGSKPHAPARGRERYDGTFHGPMTPRLLLQAYAILPLSHGRSPDASILDDAARFR